MISNARKPSCPKQYNAPSVSKNNSDAESMINKMVLSVTTTFHGIEAFEERIERQLIILQHTNESGLINNTRLWQTLIGWLFFHNDFDVSAQN